MIIRKFFFRHHGITIRLGDDGKYRYDIHGPATGIIETSLARFTSATDAVKNATLLVLAWEGRLRQYNSPIQPQLDHFEIEPD